MFKKIKKHFNKILIACFTLISSIALFSNINNTYAYETNQLTYTIESFNVYDNSRTQTLTTINGIQGYKLTQNALTFEWYIDFQMSSDFVLQNNKTYTILINFYMIDSNNNILQNYNSATNRSGVVYSVDEQTFSYTSLGPNAQYRLIQYQNLYTIINTVSTNSANPNNLLSCKILTHSSDYSPFIVNIDFTSSENIMTKEYVQSYYGNLASAYEQLQSDYNDLQDDYNDLQDDYNDLQNDYRDLNAELTTTELALQVKEAQLQELNEQYDELQSNFDNSQSIVNNNIINSLVGNNYFTKANGNLINCDTSKYTDNTGTNYSIFGPTFVNNSYLNSNTFNVSAFANYLYSQDGFHSIWQNFDSTKFFYIELYPYYNLTYPLQDFTYKLPDSQLVWQDVYTTQNWDNGALLNCKYINMSIKSTYDLDIRYKIRDINGVESLVYVERDSVTGNYEINFSSDNNNTFVRLDIPFLYYNNSLVGATEIVCNLNNVVLSDYDLGYQNGISENAVVNASLNNRIDSLNSLVERQTLTIQALNNQISAISSDYNLNNLIWTIGSTPFESFKNIWNVNFFGVNIAEVITGFLTALIALYIIKKFFR